MGHYGTKVVRLVAATGALVALVAVTHVGHMRLRQTIAQSHNSGSYPPAILPSPAALPWLSMGYNELWADHYWLMAISHFGDEAMHPYNYPDLLPLMQRVLALDPYFGGAYYFVGTALTLKGMDLPAAMALLHQGTERRPDLWVIPYLLGFNAFYFMGDYGTAAKAMAKAATFADAPPDTGPLATRLAAEAGQPEIGLRLIDQILPTITDAKLRATYETRRQLLQLEVEIGWLNQAVKKFTGTTKRTPKSLHELVQKGFLQYVPKDPMGGQYSIDTEGNVQTTTPRLHLVPPENQGQPEP